MYFLSKIEDYDTNGGTELGEKYEPGSLHECVTLEMKSQDSTRHGGPERGLKPTADGFMSGDFRTEGSYVSEHESSGCRIKFRR